MISLDPVAYVESPFQGKFAVPRQSGLARSVRAFVRVDPVWCDGLTGLDAVSHVWLVFLFHGVRGHRAATRVRPPRLGGNTRTGVFATRATHRPNPIGLSLVRLEAVHADGITVSGADLLDGTPVLDIKPYLPWAESEPDARNGIAPTAPERLDVVWTEEASAAMGGVGGDDAARLRREIEDVLGFDARPGYHVDPERVYAAEFAGITVRWRYARDACVEILGIASAAH